MDLKHMQYFVTVVEEGSFSNAAKKLHISQPPLSMMIKELENEIGTPLFVPGQRPKRLTQAGTLLYKRAGVILNLTNTALNELNAFATSFHDTLRIGVVSSVSEIFVNDIVRGFHELHSKIHWEIYETNTYDVIELLNSHSIDTALIRTPFPKIQFECIPVREEHFIAVGSYAFLADTPTNMVSLEQLAPMPLIVYRRWKKIVEDIFRQEQLTPHFSCVCDDARTAFMWANSGLGVALLPESASYNTLAQDTHCLLVNSGALHSHIVSIFCEKENRSDTLDQFHDYIKKIYR